MVELALSPTPRYSVAQLAQALRRLTGLAITTTHGEVLRHAQAALGHSLAKAGPGLSGDEGWEIISLSDRLHDRLFRQFTLGETALGMTLAFVGEGRRLVNAKPEQLGLLLQGRALTLPWTVTSADGERRLLGTGLLRAELVELRN